MQGQLIGSNITKKEEVLVNTALLARIEALEDENVHLKTSLKQLRYFRIEDIKDNDCLICFYTGFGSYMIIMSFLVLLSTS